MRKSFVPYVNLAVLMASRPAGIIGAVRADTNVDPAKIESLLKEVKGELSRVGDEVKKTAEEALKQSKDAGKVTDEVKATADKLLVAQTKLGDAQTKLEDKLKTLEERNLELEQKFAAKGRGGNAEARKSLGESVVESEDLKSFVKRGAKGSLSITVKNAITSANTSAGDLIAPQRESEIVGLPRRQMTIRQLLGKATTVSNLIEYAKQTTRTNNAGMVTEGEEKPESNYVWDLDEAAVRTIAHFVQVSRQAMDDAGQLQSLIDGELRYGLDLKEEQQLLNGTGTGQQLDGLITNATAYSPAFAVSGETLIDTLRLAVLQASLAEFPATGIVLHPTDWARIELTKDGEGRYILASIVQMLGPQIWGLPVVPTQSMTIDKFLVGAFNVAATIYDRMETEVLISSEDRDNFIKNMLTVRAEKRLALAVKRPAALIYGDGGNVT